MAIESFFSADEAAALGELARGRVVVELGSYKGGSAVIMLRAGARMVHCVDWHQGDEHVGVQDTLPAMWYHLEGAGVRDRAVLHIGRFQDVLPLFRPGWFDMAFVDGSHEQAAVARDIELVVPLVRPGGILACHDFGRWGVEAAVRAAWQRYGEGDIELTYSLAAWRLAKGERCGDQLRASASTYAQL